MPHEIADSTTETMRAFKVALSWFTTEEGREKGMGFQPRPDDVFIVTHHKCGTTWVQQV